MLYELSNSSNSNTFYNNHSGGTGGVDGDSDDQCNARRSMFVLYLFYQKRELDGEKRKGEHSRFVGTHLSHFLLLQPNTLHNRCFLSCELPPNNLSQVEFNNNILPSTLVAEAESTNQH